MGSRNSEPKETYFLRAEATRKANEEFLARAEPALRDGNRLAAEYGVENFAITIQDIKFILLCRTIEHGLIEAVHVANGLPAKVTVVHENIDLSKGGISF